VPKRPVAARQHGEDRWRREHIDLRPARAHPRVAIARWRPAQQTFDPHGEGVATKRYHRTVGKAVDLAQVAALGLAVETLGVQRLVHRASAGAAWRARTARRIGAAAGAGS